MNMTIVGQVVDELITMYKKIFEVRKGAITVASI